MMAAGDLAAGFDGNAGWDAPARRRVMAEGRGELSGPVSRTRRRLEADWYRRTGIYPMHGTIVVKDAVLKNHAWVAESIFNAFARAKDEWLAALRAEPPANPADKKYVGLRKIVGDDPLPYGDRGRTYPPSRPWKIRHSSSS